MTRTRSHKIRRTASTTIQALAVVLLLVVLLGSATRVWRLYHAALLGEVTS